MNLMNTLAFVVFPYISLAVFVLGHAYRYVTDPYSWNARSSQFLEKNETYAELPYFTGEFF
jgi:nitrate reductase gamma subunit